MSPTPRRSPNGSNRTRRTTPRSSGSNRSRRSSTNVNNGYRTNNSNTSYTRTGTIHIVLKEAVDNSNLDVFDTVLKTASIEQLKRTFRIVRPDTSNANIMNNQNDVFSNGLNWNVLDKMQMQGRPVESIRMNILQYAAVMNRTTMVRHIIEKYPSLIKTQTGNHSLLSTTMASSTSNISKVFTYLVKKGAPVKGALHFVVASEKPPNVIIDCMSILIRHGAKVNERDAVSRATPIFFATKPQVIDALILKGATINVKDRYDWTPIMTVLMGCYANNTTDPKDLIQCAHKFLDKNINVKLTGRNRNPRETEKKISLLHVASASACVLGIVDSFRTENSAYIQLYRRIAGQFSSKNIRTSLKNTPILYTLKFVNNVTRFWTEFMEERIPVNTYWRHGMPSRTRCLIFALHNLFYLGQANEKLQDADGKSAVDILHSMDSVNMNEIIRKFPFLERRNRQGPVSNVRLPNNLNFMDPITMNNVSMNNAYILTTDLHGKRNANTNRNIREIKTVYNKSTLTQLVNSTRRRGGQLVSPITRKPFTPLNIAKLVEIVPANEVSRFRNLRQRNNTTATVANNRNGNSRRN